MPSFLVLTSLPSLTSLSPHFLLPPHNCPPTQVKALSGTALPKGQWVHLAVVRDDDGAGGGTRGVRVYVDGVLQSSAAVTHPSAFMLAATTTTIQGEPEWRIGSPAAVPDAARTAALGWTASSALGPAYLDDLRVYARALNGTEITLLASLPDEGQEPFVFTQAHAGVLLPASRTQWSTWVDAGADEVSGLFRGGGGGQEERGVQIC